MRIHMKNDRSIYNDDEIVQFIKGYQTKYGWAPSVREIAAGVGILSTSTVHGYLQKLAGQGRIIYKGVRQIRVIR